MHHHAVPSRFPAAGARIARWLLAAALVLAGSAATAADLQVDPIMVEFAAGEQSQALWLTNTGTGPLKAQVRVASWTQQDGEERQQPTRDLVASPAILDIGAGERQLVRLIRTQQGPLATEAAFRLTIDELPHDSVDLQDSGVQFLLRYSVPVFVLAEGTDPLGPSRRTATSPVRSGVPAGLSARLETRGATSVLHVDNPGRQRVRLSDLAWEDGKGKRTPLVPGLFGYVLAGQRMQWPIPLSSQLFANGGSLKARFNDDPNEQTLPLETAGR